MPSFLPVITDVHRTCLNVLCVFIQRAQEVAISHRGHSKERMLEGKKPGRRQTKAREAGNASHKKLC